MSRPFSIGALALVVVGLAASSLSGQQAPVRDRPSVSSIGTGAVEGVVLTDDGQKMPLRRVQVTLSRSGVEEMRVTATDANGHYRFGFLPAGTYSLSFVRAGYLGMDYGAPRPGVPGGRSIVLAEGQAFSARPVTLPKGGVVAGRITDGAGRPAAGITVSAAQFVNVRGVRTARVAAQRSVQTNDHGEYRIYGLWPGEYLVRADGGSRVVPPPVTGAELKWIAQPIGSPPPGERATALTSTLFPGTGDPAAAVPIVLKAGEERLGIDITLVSVPLARLSGVVIGLDGKPAAGATVTRAPRRALPFSSTVVWSTRAAADGRFMIPDSTPGDYVLSARLAPAQSPAAVGLEGRPAGGEARPASWGGTEIRVTGQDITNISIVMQRAATVAGSVVMPGSTGAPIGTGTIRVQLTPDEPGLAGPGGTPSAIVAPDGSFRIDGVSPGHYRVAPVIATSLGDWLAKSASQGGRDVLDQPFEVVAAPTSMTSSSRYPADWRN